MSYQSMNVILFCIGMSTVGAYVRGNQTNSCAKVGDACCDKGSSHPQNWCSSKPDEKIDESVLCNTNLNQCISCGHPGEGCCNEKGDDVDGGLPGVTRWCNSALGSKCGAVAPTCSASGSCGSLDQECCDFDTCLHTGNGCIDGTCVKCGGKGEPCCPAASGDGFTCNDDLDCNGNKICQPRGTCTLKCWGHCHGLACRAKGSLTNACGDGFSPDRTVYDDTSISCEVTTCKFGIECPRNCCAKDKNPECKCTSPYGLHRPDTGRRLGTARSQLNSTQ